jgi:RNA polymerase sigma factor (sigma-70 family)
MTVALDKGSHTWSELETMLVQAQHGDRQAREEIVSFLYLRFLSLARERVQDEAEDVVQEMLIVVHNHLSEFKSLRGLLAFAQNVLRKRIGNAYQRRTRDRNLAAVLRGGSLAAYDLVSEWELADLDRVLRQGMEHVSQTCPYCRVVFTCLYEGMSAREIRHRLGVSQSRLKYMTFRCRQALRAVLLDQYSLRV